MRIGELAALTGVTPRTVRHYHRIGLLPEPVRRANGYRVYGLRDAVALARVRRLTELGLSLDEVRDVLADDAGKELREVLSELDADLARQEETIRLRRARLAELLELSAEGEGLPAEGPVSAEVAAVFREMARTSAKLPGPEPAMAAKERELIALLDGTASTEARGWLAAMTRSMGADPAAMERAYEVYVRMDALAEAPVGDPRVAELARAIAAQVPDEVVDAMADAAIRDSDAEPGGAFAEALYADFAPAQAEAIRQAVRLLQEQSP
ncbi:MerR family transcriptional regulator [Streptomyces zagrosensis]|uniref:DNA-binding transcriptional MerR regulator n=1 Tax=Streptomyces zagrosensis TaxID=1042984 RepID=A0A7W9QAD6_9ACTN|nr:MerR family transcriptional regulator [Streptomyces zagrosensis]MBB5936545.1 DNA-binding transcriptional MerR regulator [Streptomyces zagrosensis]